MCAKLFWSFSANKSSRRAATLVARGMGHERCFFNVSGVDFTGKTPRVVPLKITHPIKPPSIVMLKTMLHLQGLPLGTKNHKVLLLSHLEEMDDLASSLPRRI
jgi:hypothetical protein